jgi:hypothetical protein
VGPVTGRPVAAWAIRARGTIAAIVGTGAAAARAFVVVAEGRARALIGFAAEVAACAVVVALGIITGFAAAGAAFGAGTGTA